MDLKQDYKERLKTLLLEIDVEKVNVTYISLANTIVDFILNRVPVESTHNIKNVVNNNTNELCNAICNITIVDVQRLLKYIDAVVNYRKDLIFVTDVKADLYSVNKSLFTCFNFHKHFSKEELDSLSNHPDLYDKVRFVTIQYLSLVTKTV